MNLDIKEIERLYPHAFQLFNISKHGYMEFFDSQGMYIHITPEFYKEGINWNLQIFWYKDQTDWPKRPKKNVEHYLTEGTMMYGDNNEFPTRESANEAACIFAFELLERKLTGKKILPDFIEELHGDILSFHKLLKNIKTD